MLSTFRKTSVYSVRHAEASTQAFCVAFLTMVSTCTVKGESLNQWKEGIVERHENLGVCEKAEEKRSSLFH